jgi:hypothetical protein
VLERRRTKRFSNWLRKKYYSILSQFMLALMYLGRPCGRERRYGLPQSASQSDPSPVRHPRIFRSFLAPCYISIGHLLPGFGKTSLSSAHLLRPHAFPPNLWCKHGWPCIVFSLLASSLCLASFVSDINPDRSVRLNSWQDARRTPTPVHNLQHCVAPAQCIAFLGSLGHQNVTQNFVDLS